MRIKKKVLFFGPFIGPTTGQSVSFRQSYLNFKHDKILFDTNQFKSLKFLNSLYCLLVLPWFFLICNFDKVYFTSTRSNLGFIKDFQLLLLSRIFKKKIINHLHGADFLDFYSNSKFLKKIIFWSYNQIDVSIVLLPSMIEQYSDFRKMKVEVISNCYANEYLNSKVCLEQKKNEIIFLSNLIFSKGIFVFLSAAREILKQDKSVVVKIAGLPMGDSLMSVNRLKFKFEKISKILKEEFPDRFFYLGLVKGNKKEELLKNSSIFVLPTFYKTEAFPITIIEAMYFGNAIITTNHNYLKDIIGEENGFLIKPKSVDNLVSQTLFLLRNKHLCLKIQRHNHIVANDKYNPNTFNSNLNRVILNS
jgi:glycosyltransferase involved in cell wall biosynthesis